MALAIDRDTSTTPINFIRFQNATGNGASVNLSGSGFEWSGAGDVQGSGSAAGFKVTNAANTLDGSPGASNSIAAGNSAGGTASTSHGGDNTITGGSYVGAGNNRGGDVTLTAGNSSGTGRGGNVNLNFGTGTPNGQVLCNGNPCFNPAILQMQTSTTLDNTAISNCSGACQTVIHQAITMPSSGCPCRVSATWWLYMTVTTSGVDAAYVIDNVGGTGFAGNSTASAGSFNSGWGFNGAGKSPQTYANGAAVTFNLIMASSHSGGTTITSTPGTAITGAPISSLQIAVLSSN
jgi:hypothetical protein